MNNKEFLAELSKRLDVPTKEATRLMEAFNKQIATNLENEDVVSIQGFGTFEAKKKLEHVVVNPSSRLKMLVPPKIEVKFKPSPVLKDKIN